MYTSMTITSDESLDPKDWTDTQSHPPQQQHSYQLYQPYTLAERDRPNSSFHQERRFEGFLCRVELGAPGTPYTGSGSANQSLCSSSASRPSSQV
ncbi:hypothetical protein E2C01_018413 [Portunus trituberculatus]|uniref:Uncharacterized protein n=1 Tax=Portunus trituberculatus TaxID=210409 RepID=A0A5B7DW28_PORTR|nr:hypothetical protein [Portunus trituberculatus]